MNLPKAVLEQAQRADELHQRAYGENTGSAPAPAPAPVATPAPTPAPGPAPAPAPAVTPQANAPAPESAEAPNIWELRYRSLEGKYRTEVPALHAEVRQLREENSGLKAQIESGATKAPVATQSLRDQLGDELAEAVAAVASEQVKGVQQKLDQVSGSLQQQTRQAFFASLAAYVPNFAEVDSEPGFTEYLDSFDPLTGKPRRAFFQEADQANDAARVAVFFRSYLASKAANSPAPSPAPAPAPAVPSADALVVPDSSRQTSVPQAKKMWTTAEIRAFYAAARQGRYTQAQYDAIDADISVAQREGRLLD